jgi:hypothetical protein
MNKHWKKIVKSMLYYAMLRLATSRPWGREGAGKGTRDPSDEVASGRLVSLAGI